MSEVFYLLCLLCGIALLIYGANWFVNGASVLAKKLHISPLIIGLTIVAIGTSLPELAVSLSSSISASLQGTTADIGLGNVIGSNMANIALVLGVCLLFSTVEPKKSLKTIDYLFLFGSTFAFLLFLLVNVLGQFPGISQFEGMFLFLGFIAFLVVVIALERRSQKHELVQLAVPSAIDPGKGKEESLSSSSLTAVSTTTEPSPLPSSESAGEITIPTYSTKKAIIFFLLGLVGVVLGGIITTWSAEEFSVHFLYKVLGMDQSKAKTLIGLSLVAIGTSLPELVTSVVALRKHETALSLGNVFGSCIINLLLIVGLSGTIVPLETNQDVSFDGILLGGMTVILLGLILFSKKLGKKTGIFFLVLYVAYLTFIILRAFGIIPSISLF